MVKVLVVDDSETMRAIMTRALAEDPDIEIAGEAEDGRQAVDMVRSRRPDVVTMDILMPVMNGLDATREIMELDPTPIVMVSAIGDSEEQMIGFQAMEAGAVWVIKKPRGEATANWKQWSASLRGIVKSMAEVQVVSRRAAAPKTEKARPRAAGSGQKEIVVIASSTGGPPILRRILAPLPADYPIPVLVCQHIAKGFVQGLADWLQPVVNLPVRVASRGMRVLPGITFAPDHAHMELAGGDEIAIAEDDGSSYYLPSADRLFSTAALRHGKRVVAVMLTGMGRDGAGGMMKLHELGATTIAQDEASSLIYGMPRAAVEAGAVSHQLDPEAIVGELLSLPARNKDRERKKPAAERPRIN